MHNTHALNVDIFLHKLRSSLLFVSLASDVACLPFAVALYLMKLITKYQERPFGKLQCRPFKSGRFWVEQAHQGSEFPRCVQNDWRDWKL